MARLTDLLDALTNPAQRDNVSRVLAEFLVCDRAYLFVPDVKHGDLSPLLPFDGTPSTLRSWRERLRDDLGPRLRTMPNPVTGDEVDAATARARNGGVVVAIGGRPRVNRLRTAAMLLPLLASVNREDQTQSTEQRAHTEGERHITLLSQAGDILARGRNTADSLCHVASVLVDSYCDVSLVYLVDDRGQCREICKAKRRNWSRTKAAGSAEGLPPSTPKAVLRTLATGRPAVLEMRERSFGASPMLLAAVPILTGRNSPIGAIAIGRSGTQASFSTADVMFAGELARRAALAFHFEQLSQDARQASVLKDDFLATLSHELRTPLNAMLGWILMLRLYPGDETIRGRAVEVLERNARAQAQLVSDLLDMSRIIRGSFRIRRAVVDLRDIVTTACETVHPAAEIKGVHLWLEVGDVPGQVLGDRDRLQQIVWNLLSNAIKFTPTGGRVQVRVSQRETHAEICVSDSGVGIRPEFLPHVFERFRQSDSTITRSHGGIGLGLAIVRHLTELHGGSVHATSEGEARGATFWVRLPFRPEHATLRPASPMPSADSDQSAQTA
jgi:signal transduction histidine kinase